MIEDDLSGTTLDGVALERRVASGILTDIYVGRTDNGPVAVKILSPEALGDHGEARFVREGRILADLDHPGLLRIHRLGYDAGHFFLVMDWLSDAVNLHEWVSRNTIELTDALTVTSRLCQPLSYLHGRDLVHRDIKPRNVCVRPGGHPVLMDFTLIKDRSAALKLTQTGAIMGTVGFMAPEQVEGRFGDVCAQTDLYALGASLYWLLTGQRPFKSETPMKTIIHILREAPLPPSSQRAGIPPAVDDLVLELLAKRPTDRPDSAEEVADRIANLLQAHP